MMRIFLFCLFTPILLQAQYMGNSIGVLSLNDQAFGRGDSTLKLFNADGTLWYEWNVYATPNQPKNLRPLDFKPHYFLFNAKCLQKNRLGYEVVINRKGTTKFIHPSPKVSLISWQQYVLNAFSIKFKQSRNRIRREPRGRYRFVSLSRAIVQPVKIEGDWLQVRWCKKPIPDQPQYEYGWIKWRKKDQLIVKLYPFN